MAFVPSGTVKVRSNSVDVVNVLKYKVIMIRYFRIFFVNFFLEIIQPTFFFSYICKELDKVHHPREKNRRFTIYI